MKIPNMDKQFPSLPQPEKSFATGQDVVAGAISGAVSGAIVGLAADSIAAAGITGVLAVGIMAASGGVAGIVGDVINQAGNKLEYNKDVSLRDSVKNIANAVKSVDGKSVVRSGTIGVVAGGLTGGTSVVLNRAANTSVALYKSIITNGADSRMAGITSKMVVGSYSRASLFDNSMGPCIHFLLL